MRIQAIRETISTTQTMSDNNEQAPDILYKYFPPYYGESLEEGIIPYFKTAQNLRLSQPGALNDPYECLPDFSEATIPEFSISREDQKQCDKKIKEDNGYSYLEMKKVKGYAKAKIRRDRRENPEIERQAIFENYPSLVDQSFGILSLSSSWNNAVMWAHYGQQYTGFVLGFHKNHEAFKSYPIFRVHYTPERFKFTGDPSNNEDIKNQISSILSTKNENWGYEDEWRLIGAQNTLKVLNSSLDSRELPILGLHFPYEALAEVILGKDINPRIEEKILSDRSNYAQAKVYKAQLHAHNYNLDREYLGVI